MDRVLYEGKVDPSLEHRLLMPDGSIKHLRVWGRPSINESGSFEVVGAVTDVTEQKQAEEALRASEERWRKLFENSSAGIALIAPDGRYLAINLALQKMLGYTNEELDGITAADLMSVEEHAACEQLRTEVLAGLRQAYRVERRFRRKDGTDIWTDVSAVLMVATGSQSAFFAVVIVDINERKRAEEELRRSEAFLAQGNKSAIPAVGPGRSPPNHFTGRRSISGFLGWIRRSTSRPIRCSWKEFTQRIGPRSKSSSAQPSNSLSEVPTNSPLIRLIQAGLNS
jgi:PAS domain S-box-containing protein